ncbi:MAG: hypothetical protein KF774_07180 [Planctomyces sp.]|nr:hypothetical protein [Planctomyces sp.]
MFRSPRREFLSQVGRGMLVATLGPAVSADLGMSLARAEDIGDRLTFGDREELVDFLQSTPPDRMLREVVARVRQGTSLREIISAAALANGRAFAGEDYIGFHTLMALRPALMMAEESPSELAPLPVLKVLYRNSSRIQEAGADAHDGLHPTSGGEAQPGSAAIREAVHRGDRAAAERSLAASIAGSPEAGFNALLDTVYDGVEVHRVVLVSRAWDMLSLVGREHADTMLRQSLRYCLQHEPKAAQYYAPLRELLPRLVDEYRLDRQDWGSRDPGNDWVQSFMATLWTSTPAQAAEATAAALRDGIAPARIFEAVALMSNQLLLCDAGRPPEWTGPGKPEGSVHGDSVGVHSSDATHAWRQIALAADTRQRNLALLLAAFHAAQDRSSRNAEFAAWQPRPWPEHLERVASDSPGMLLDELRRAIEANDQELACAVTARYGTTGGTAEPLFGMFRDYAISEDGALHAEKYFYTVRDNFRTSAPQFRWRHLTALARVTASEYGRPAPGYEDACGLLQG